MLAILIALFIIVPLAELYVIIQVGQAIGALPTIGLLLLDSLLGSWLLRSQGRAVWRRFQGTLAAGRIPAREVVDGVLVIGGGALLLTPGFITDVFGVLFLAPPTRAAVRGGILRHARSRLFMGLARRAPRGGPRRDYDVDATGDDVPPPPPLAR
jgi:UPF0716 protein FxsA